MSDCGRFGGGRHSSSSGLRRIGGTAALVLTLAAPSMAVYASTIQQTPARFCPAGDPCMFTLQELFSGLNVSVGRMTFENWRLVDADDALSPIDERGVTVAFAGRGRRVDITLSSDQFHAGELEGNYEFAYEARVNRGVGVRLFELGLLDAGIDGEGSAELFVRASDQVIAGGGPSFASVEITQFPFDSTKILVDRFAFDEPLEMLPVFTRITLAGSAAEEDEPGASVSLERFRERFFLVTEPGSLPLACIGLLITLIGVRIRGYKTSVCA